MPESTPASSGEDAAISPHPAEFLGLPASESSTSSISQYHSALNSPVCESPNPSSIKDQPERNLISFSSGNLCVLAGPSEPRSPPPSPPLPSTSSVEPKSPEFSSNRHKNSVNVDEHDTTQTPNVYVNGLPPYFREDQLLAIAAPFGEVVSVRTFTRHTKSASGYGFVLFKDLSAAERCVLMLRRSDLQAALSKVNKPPRIVCDPNSPTFPMRLSSSSLSSSDPNPGSPELSFKDRMAQLEDKKSTNVYIEGLPMSADRNTLLDLVYPYAILSSRFLRSKLPQSQSMIAFMRMDSRAAAEDVIVRLNGKKVRGWDDTESRIYLRFADTLDQRELRRSEANARADHADTGRLSIAQATLLSYRGKELQQSHSNDSNNSNSNTHSNSANFNSNVSLHTSPPAGVPMRNAPPPPPYHSLPPMHGQGHGYGHGQLPYPLAASIHDLLVVQAQAGLARPPVPFPQDPLYAPYAAPPPPMMQMHPNVVALFNELEAMQQAGGCQFGGNNVHTLNAGARNFAGSVGVGVGGLRRAGAESFVTQVQAGHAAPQGPTAPARLNTNTNTNMNASPGLEKYLLPQRKRAPPPQPQPQPRRPAPAPPAQFSPPAPAQPSPPPPPPPRRPAPGKAHIWRNPLGPRPPAGYVPPSAALPLPLSLPASTLPLSTLALSTPALPTSTLPLPTPRRNPRNPGPRPPAKYVPSAPPIPTPAPTKPQTQNNVAGSTNDILNVGMGIGMEPPPQFGFTSTHARAATAPVGAHPYLRSIDNVLAARARERTTTAYYVKTDTNTNATTNAHMKTNDMSMNMNMNTNANQNQNIRPCENPTSAKLPTSATPAANILLPLLRFT
ncbi:hypothetical protein DFH07DRAFT_941654 [Mycena maculata]|uniref:RRM domain-containing protein n=1 Tax=Mycena maculata TaxID=230809 RepID=A0AAD7IVX1_9AGAR|nr:hypothetical protein DFH07DRAFT_941654 [Mycena maculata]